MPLALAQNVINLTYVVAALLLILGIKRLSSPSTARSGNFVAVVFATINVVGGFLVTDRMLEMFKRKPSKPDSE